MSSVAWVHPGAVLSVLTFGLLIGLVAWFWARGSVDSPWVLLLKVLVSIVLIGAGVLAMLKISPYLGVPLAACAGVIVGVLWARNIGLALVKPLTSLYDGGTESDAPKPFYAIAEARRKQGRHEEAVALIGEQLERFPGDPKGLLLLAEVRCRHLGDWDGAVAAIDEIASNEALEAPTRAKALQALGDWQVELGRDEAGARATYQRILDLFPGTPEATEAAQRLAHVGDGQWRRAQTEPIRLTVRAADPSLGLRVKRGETGGEPAPAEPDAEAEVGDLLARLREHPVDTEARERLARVYLDRMGRLDWAVAEAEKLIALPGQGARAVARWLHLLADLHVRGAGDEAAAREALERIGRLYPGSAVEAAARSRLERIKVEIRGRKTGQAFQPGPMGESRP